MKKVLFLSPQPFFSTRGTPINIRAMAEILTARGYAVKVLTLPFGENVKELTIERVAKIPFTKCPPIGPSFTKLMYSFLMFFTALRLSKWADVIHGFEEGAMIGGLSGMLTSVPYIADVDSCMVMQLRQSRYGMLHLTRLFGWCEKVFLRRAAAAITVCSALTRTTAEKAPNLPIYQIEDFPLDESLVVDAAKYAQIRERFAGKRTLLYTGNLEAYQGTELMIRAYAKYLRENPDDTDTILLIVGGTKKGILHLRGLSAECGIGSRIILDGPKLPSDMGAYMAASDFFLSPRIAGENVPLKLFTYLAAAKPLIATRILSHTQIVSDESAFLGEPTVDGYSEALRDALTSPNAAKKAQLGADLVRSKYSKEHFKRRLLDAYEQILPLTEPMPVPVFARQQNQ